MPVGYAPAWSPDAERIAYVMPRRPLGRGRGRHAPLAAGRETPTSRPGRRTARRLAFVARRRVWTVRADGLDQRRLAVGAHPDWSPDGARHRVRPRRRDLLRALVRRRRPAGRGRRHRPGLRARRAGSPSCATASDRRRRAWSATGIARLVAERRAGRLRARRQALRRRPRCRPRQQPAWRPACRRARAASRFRPACAERALIAGGLRGHWLLGFTSLVDNVGLGQSMIVGVRHARPAAHDRDAAREARERPVAHVLRTPAASATRTRPRTTTGT